MVGLEMPDDRLRPRIQPLVGQLMAETDDQINDLRRETVR